MTSNETITDSGANKPRGTDRHTSQPEEVLFFANAHFLFFNFTADAHYNTFASRSNLRTTKTCKKVVILPTHPNRIFL
jgi:hypothetical protein